MTATTETALAFEVGDLVEFTSQAGTKCVARVIAKGRFDGQPAFRGVWRGAACIGLASQVTGCKKRGEHGPRFA